MIDDNCPDHQTDLDQVVQKDFELADVVRGKRAGWYILKSSSHSLVDAIAGQQTDTCNVRSLTMAAMHYTVKSENMNQVG